ncbi:MAG: helix-turn-helix domain-containing protein [Acidobacteria bacterium]|nr:helix-turn-helix domain-containing protein [Acidobacteriota bacterium]
MAPGDLAAILTVSEVAEFLRVPRKTVYQLVRSGELPAFKAGRHWRVTREAVGIYIASATRTARNGSLDGGRPA